MEISGGSMGSGRRVFRKMVRKPGESRQVCLRFLLVSEDTKLDFWIRILQAGRTRGEVL